MDDVNSGCDRMGLDLNNLESLKDFLDGLEWNIQFVREALSSWMTLDR